MTENISDMGVQSVQGSAHLHRRWGRVPAILLLSGVMWITLACGMGAKYGQDRLNDATQDMISKHYGAPHKVESIQEGGQRWTYFERGSGTAAFSGQSKAGGCRAYILTFDAQHILREWQEQACRG